MALSYVQYEGDGVQETFPIPFPYLDRSHIEVRVALDVHPYTWDDSNTIRISPAPPAGAVVEARRITPRDYRMVDFVDGSVLTESDLDLNALQTFYIVQEAIDIAGGTLELLSDGSFGAGGRRIRELGMPVDLRDAVTKEYHDGTWIPQMQSLLSQTTAARDNANTYMNTALSARDAAIAARDLAQQYRDTANNHRQAAATSESNALSYKNSAATSESNAAISASTANSHKNAAEAAKTAAESAKTAAETARNVTQGYRNEAETFKNQAAASAAVAATFDPANYYTKLVSDDRFAFKSHTHDASQIQNLDSQLTNFMRLDGSTTMNGQLLTRRINASQGVSGVTSLRIQNAGGTGDNGLAAMDFLCDGSYGIHLHLRADGYFGIGGWSRPNWSWYSAPNGDMIASGNVAAYSDPRLKDDVEKIEGALAIIEQLDGVRFTWNGKTKLIGRPGKRDIGVLADQVEKVLPELVSLSVPDEANDGEQWRVVAYEKIVPVLIEALKELSARVKELEAR